MITCGLRTFPIIVTLSVIYDRNKFNPSRLPSGWSDTLLATPSTLPSHTAVVNIYLPATAINALATHLEPGPFKSGHFDSTWNMYSVLNVQATLKSVEEEFEGDVKGIIPTDQPYPFIYDASMGTENSEYEKLPRVGVLVSISGHELDRDR